MHSFINKVGAKYMKALTEVQRPATLGLLWAMGSRDPIGDSLWLEAEYISLAEHLREGGVDSAAFKGQMKVLTSVTTFIVTGAMQGRSLQALRWVEDAQLRVLKAEGAGLLSRELAENLEDLLANLSVKLEDLVLFLAEVKEGTMPPDNHEIPLI